MLNVWDMNSHPPRRSCCVSTLVHAANGGMFPAMQQKSHTAMHGTADVLPERQGLPLLSTVPLPQNAQCCAKKLCVTTAL